ncbi:MAG: class I SAM-dependent methyltransferase [Lawsonibacter sp.]|nr:class I SAM-dependent methyltransferase [Lawsonibacter sp.]
MKKAIVLEIGRKAREVVKKIGIEHIECFADSASENLEPICGIPVISFEEMIRRWPVCDIILAIRSEELERKLQACGVTYWKNDDSNESYFMRQDVMDIIDEKLLDRYYYDMEAKFALFSERYEARFREEYYSEKNEALVEAFRTGNREFIQTFLENAYADNKIYFDEFYSSRPGMRLIRNIITSSSRRGNAICELACGHGELLKQLKADGFRVQGVDSSFARVEEVRASGIDCICGDVAHTPFPDSCFDFVICMECLEHVGAPEAVVREANRLLMGGGMIFCTTPYGNFCDCTGHLRQFSENSLCALFTQNGFDIVNILRIPYLNSSLNDNLFVAAVKK